MENVRKLLDQVKHVNGIESDYALAKRLELPKQRVSEYYSGKAVPNDYACLQIANALNIPLAQVIAAVNLDAEKDEKRRSAWEKYYKQLGGVAASLILGVLISVTFFVTPASSMQPELGILSASQFVLCQFLLRWMQQGKP